MDKTGAGMHLSVTSDESLPLSSVEGSDLSIEVGGYECSKVSSQDKINPIKRDIDPNSELSAKSCGVIVEKPSVIAKSWENCNERNDNCDDQRLACDKIVSLSKIDKSLHTNNVGIIGSHFKDCTGSDRTCDEKKCSKSSNVDSDSDVTCKEIATCTEENEGMEQSSEHLSLHTFDSSDDESDCILSEQESELEDCISGNMNAFLPKKSPQNKSHISSTKCPWKNPAGDIAGEESMYEYLVMQVEFLERCNKKLTDDLSEERNKLSTVEDEHCVEINNIKEKYENRIKKLSKQCENLQKEKEVMVIRYANSEKEVILSIKLQNELERKFKDCSKERESSLTKIKALTGERLRLCNSLDSKLVELANLQREHEKLKELLNSKDIKIKWAQTKLKTEMDAHKETQLKLEHTLQRLQEMREEAEQIRKDCQEMIGRYQEAEEIKSVSLDHQLKQKLSELEIQKQERSDQEEVYQLLRQELEALKKKQRITIEENNSLTLKIHSLEKERLEYEQTLSKLKDNQNSYKQEVVDLMARLAEMDNLSSQLEREKEKLTASIREVERLRHTNAELQSDMDACHMKEGELLEFTERLTAKTVHLQSEHGLLEAKVQNLEEEIMHMNKQYSELEQRNCDLVLERNEEQKQRLEETQLLARKLAEKTKAVEQLNMKLEEADNENRVIKRRHTSSIKELSRELQQCRKKIEILELGNCGPAESASLGSRASSSGSLDNVNSTLVMNGTGVSGVQVSPPVSFSGGKNSCLQIKNCTQSSATETVLPIEVDKRMLIKRIVKLQKNLDRKNDKIEFLEEHTDQLIKEIKKKYKIIQSYILREETGALISNSSDQNKLEFTRRGGIMASVYSSQLSDNHMTLELSLEINHKLQAVLEDTLLKNITLKENINTLGEEIARLTSERRELCAKLSRRKSVVKLYEN